MADSVRVRFVPKTKDGRSIAKDLAEITPSTSKASAPDPKRAGEAERVALALGLVAKITRHNSIEAQVPIERFHGIFGAKLRDTANAPQERSVLSSRRTGGDVKLTVPDAELGVPDRMTDTIAFAYVPTPVEFFASSYIPPNVADYHLRLSEVCAALHGASCHTRGWRGTGVRIAMTDTGFFPHPYFDRQGYVILRVRTPEVSEPGIDTNGHGTGESANALALAPESVLIGVKHRDYSALALETALEQDPHIVTNSWGWAIDSQSKPELQTQNPNLFNEIRDVENIINDAIDDGVVMIFSAGNGHLAFPASMPGRAGGRWRDSARQRCPSGLELR